MRSARRCFVALLAIAGAGLPSTGGSGARAGEGDHGSVRKVRLGIADLASPAPADFRAPEGKSRWDLTALRGKASIVLSLAEGPGGAVLVDETSGLGRDEDR